MKPEKYYYAEHIPFVPRNKILSIPSERININPLKREKMKTTNGYEIKKVPDVIITPAPPDRTQK